MRDESWLPAPDTVGEAKLALADELEDGCSGVVLGDAGDAQAIGCSYRGLRADLAEAAGDGERVVAVAAEQDDTGSTGGDERVSVVLQRCLGAGAVRRSRGSGDHEDGASQPGEDRAGELDRP